MTDQEKFREIRERFNFGYHDGAKETFHGRPRKRVMSGPHTPEQVSYEYSHAYFYGHQLGQMDAEWKRYTGSSEAAWNLVAPNGEVPYNWEN
jgi:hypothetical protein